MSDYGVKQAQPEAFPPDFQNMKIHSTALSISLALLTLLSAVSHAQVSGPTPYPDPKTKPPG